MLKKHVAIDYETHRISEAQPTPKPVCLSFYDGEAAGLKVGQEEMEGYLTELLNSDAIIIAHNTTFECLVTYVHFPKLKAKLIQALKDKRIICTAQMQKLINNVEKKGPMKVALSELVKYYFDEDISESKKDPDAWRLRYAELDGVPLSEWPQGAIDYAIDDSIWAYRLYMEKQRRYKLNYAECVESAFYLNYIGNFGICINQDRVLELEREIYGLLEGVYSRLIERGFCEPILNSPRPKKNMNAFREYIKKVIKEPLISPKGTIKTTGEAMEAYYLESLDDVFKDFITVNLYDKALTGYINNIKTDLVRTQYDSVKSTGRTSSFKSSLIPSVNIQNIPRGVPGVKWDIRNCFFPRPGFKLVSIDYSGLELASSANQLKKYFGKSKMCDTLNSGEVPTDMHSKLACQIMSIQKGRKITYEEFVSKKKEKEYARFRQLSKPINLGFPGGIGYDTMRGLLLKDGIKTGFDVMIEHENKNALLNAYYACRADYPDIRIARLNKKKYAIVRDELVALKNALLDLYPELGAFLRDAHEMFTTGEYRNVRNEYGEWEREAVYEYDLFGFKRGWCSYTAFCNGYLMQTPSAIGAKKMMNKVIEKYLDNPDVNVLAFIHDEVLFEVRDTEAKYLIVEDVSEIMIDEMQKVLTEVRIAVEASEMDYWMKAGGNWEVTYFKDAGSTELKKMN